MGEGYIDLKFEPRKKDLVVEFRLEPNNISFEKAANHIAGESSIGTWTDITTTKKSIRKQLGPHIFYISEKYKTVRIAYPEELFEKGNMPQILSSIGGNIFGMRAVKHLRLEDIHFPEHLVKSFKGPVFGIKGIRKLLKVPYRPLVGTVIKPKVGLHEREHAKVAHDAWFGGCDIVKDDENLANMSFNKFTKRVDLTLKQRDHVERETGERKVYMPNITAETKEMIKRAKYVRKQHGEYIMVDIITMGWAALQTVRNENLGRVIHAHRAGHAMITRTNQGMSMTAIGKIARLIGVDQLHVGTAHVGKMEGEVKEVQEIEDEIENKMIVEDKKQHVLEQDWYNIKPVFAVASGGLHPGSVKKLIQRMGMNIIMQFGGGIHGHKMGTVAGSKAARQALEAVMQGINLEEHAKKNKELRIALKQWGQS
ncbi:MAG: type III ribulose-bisphosphate carboxylase [archaeon]